MGVSRRAWTDVATELRKTKYNSGKGKREPRRKGKERTNDRERFS